MPARQLIARLVAEIPGATPLPLLAWAPRHRWIVRLLWLHLLLISVVALLQGYGVLHAVVECAPVLGLALLAGRTWNAPWIRSIAASLGLMLCSALLVHLSDGLTEMHFHFFVMLGVISLYHDWRPFLLSIAFVAVHHGVLGVLSPHEVFDRQAAWQEPVKWAGIHAFFVLASCAASVVSWRIVEDSDRDARAGLEASERRFRALIENSSDVVTVLDAAGTILYVSPSSEHILGYPASERIGSSGLDTVHPDDLPRMIEVLDRLVDKGQSVSHIEMRVQHRNGTYLWVDASAANLLDEPGLEAIVWNFHEITERKGLENELAHQAFHDSLTGLANRALLLDRVEHALQRTRGTKAPSLALLFLDLDDFKIVNDALGHQAGDTILRIVAERIAGALRPGDTASRLGGDEFAVLIEEVPGGPAKAHEIGARLLEQVCTPFDVDQTLIAVNASLGIAVSDGTEDAAGLLRNADLAMYRAKSSGKGRFEVYEAGMHRAVVERMALKADLRRGVDAGEFEPYYQPIVDLATGLVTGVEALARWNHPEHGVVEPVAFIPLAEETGWIVEIGRVMLGRACLDAAGWRDALGAAAPQSVSVNLSPRQIQHPDLVAHVRAALENSHLPPSSLILEITESVLLDDTDVVDATLAALKALGVRIALDDFGTGFSSLSYLHRFPVDIVKIDKSFIDSLATTATPSPLVSAIVNLGAVLGVGVTAEGIEDQDQLARLRAMGCGHGQGYYFAKPLTESGLRELLNADRPTGSEGPLEAHNPHSASLVV